MSTNFYTPGRSSNKKQATANAAGTELLRIYAEHWPFLFLNQYFSKFS
jgi:hypothetical protein